MGRPMAEFLLAEYFRRRTRCVSFGKFSSCTWPGFTLQGRCPARALTLLCGKMRVSLKKGDVNKKFRRGRGYLQIVQERSGVAHSCLSTLVISIVVQCKPLTKDHLPLTTAFSGPKGWWSLVTGFTLLVDRRHKVSAHDQP